MDNQQLDERVKALEKEKELFFDVAYRSYTELAAIADDCTDKEAARRIGGAIAGLGMMIGRAETREHPR